MTTFALVSLRQERNVYSSAIPMILYSLNSSAARLLSEICFWGFFGGYKHRAPNGAQHVAGVL